MQPPRCRSQRKTVSAFLHQGPGSPLPFPLLVPITIRLGRFLVR